MTLIILIILILMLAAAFFLEKIKLNPPVILICIWILPFLLLAAAKPLGLPVEQVNKYALAIPIGTAIFTAGYFLINRDARKTDKIVITGPDVRFSVLFKIIVVLEIIVTLYFLYHLNSFVKDNFRLNYWYTYKVSKDLGTYKEPFFIPYFRTFARTVLCVLCAYVFSEKLKGRDLIWVALQVLVTCVMHILGPGRNEIFAFLVPIGMAYLIVNSSSLLKLIKNALILAVILLAVFFFYYYLKYTEASAKIGDTPLGSFEAYLCGGVVAFSQWAAEGHELAHGAYTFRLIFAVLNRLGFNVPVAKIVEEFRTLFNAHRCNVYTVYKWYANDFGVIFSVLMQLPIGMIHGIITKKFYKRQDVKALTVYCISFFPLIMQFFNDEYFSKASTWIQVFLWLFIFLGTGLMIKQRTDDARV